MNERENFSLGIKEFDEVNAWDKKWLQYYVDSFMDCVSETIEDDAVENGIKSGDGGKIIYAGPNYNIQQKL